MKRLEKLFMIALSGLLYHDRPDENEIIDIAVEAAADWGANNRLSPANIREAIQFLVINDYV